MVLYYIFDLLIFVLFIIVLFFFFFLFQVSDLNNRDSLKVANGEWMILINKFARK